MTDVLKEYGITDPQPKSSILSEYGITPSEAPQSELEGIAHAVGKNAANVPLFGYYPEVAAATKSAVSSGAVDPRKMVAAALWKVFNGDGEYETQKKLEYENLNKEIQQHPIAAKVGTGLGVAGSLAGSMAAPAMGIIKAATTPWGRMAQGAGSLAATSFASNPGQTEGLDAQIPERLNQVKQTMTNPWALALGVGLPGIPQSALERQAYMSKFRGLGGYKAQNKLIPEATQLEIGKNLMDNFPTTLSRKGMLNKLEDSTENIGQKIGNATEGKTEATIPLSSLKEDAINSATKQIGGTEGSTQVLGKLDNYLSNEALVGLPVEEKVVGMSHGGLGNPITEKYVSPNTAHEIQKRLQDSINWKAPEGKIQPMAYRAGRTSVAGRVMDEVPELQELSKPYHLQQTAEDIVRNKLQQESGKLRFGPMEMMGAGLGEVGGALTGEKKNPWEKLAYGLLGGLAMKGARNYGLNTEAMLLHGLANVNPAKAGMNAAIWERLKNGGNNGTTDQAR